MPFVPVSIPTQNAYANMQAHTLLEFRNSPVFQAVLSAIAVQKQQLMDAIVGVMQAFMPQNAVGVQEDAIGRIVGAYRGVVTVAPWFTPDDPYYGNPDQTPVWVTNASSSGSLVADDTSYRNMIFAKVFRNFVQVGSIQDIQDFIFDLFGVNSSIILSGPMQIKIILQPGASPNIIAFLEQAVSNNQVDYLTTLPFPPGMQLSEVVVQMPLVRDADTGSVVTDADTGGQVVDPGV